MLEGLVAGLLNRFLGMYVKNFDPTQLKVGIWSGDVNLRNLELRREALDQLKLPINVVEGHLGELTLVIPWSNLRGAPVKVFVRDVFLLASPREEAAYDDDEEERRKQRIKMEKLDSAELLKERSREGLSQDEQKRSQSFMDSLITKIVDNLQITIKNFHIRYEDSISTEGHPFALGMTLEEFSAVSTDAGWKPTFIQTSSTITHKLATLGALAIYWNTDTSLLGSGREVEIDGQQHMEHDELVEQFRTMIGKADGSLLPPHQFILRPVSGQAKIEMNKSGDLKAPKMKASLLFEEIGLVLDDAQYRDALMMVDLFHYFIRHQEYKKMQPKNITPKQDPRAWFRFAGNAVLAKIHDRNRRWSWDYFRERRDDRRQYIELFNKKKQNQQLSPPESADLDKLERKLSYEDLRFWRSLARNQLRKENAEAAKMQPVSQSAHSQQQKQQQQGWLSWAFGAAKTNDHKNDAGISDDENTQITEEQRKELYEAIEWDEKVALAESVDVPRDSVKMQVDMSLSTGSFTLRRGQGSSSIDLLSLHFDVFKAKGLTRPDSFFGSLSLGGFRVNDGTTPDSLYPEIVRVKDAPAVTDKKRLSLTDLENSDDEPFFEFELEQNPIDREGDVAIVGKLKPLEIMWNPNFVVSIVDFFKPPERHMESINALMESAGSTLGGITDQTRAGLMFALEEHKTINAQLDLQAPLIIVPVSITTEKSTCMIIDAGHIAVHSELVDQATLKQIQSKDRTTFTDEDFKRLESAMYDKFLVKCTSTQVLIGPSVEETKSQLTERSEVKMLHIVERIGVDFIVETSIIPKAPNIPKLKVSGHLPVLHAMVSDSKYKTLMRIIDVAIPKFGDSDGQEQAQSQVRKRPSHQKLLSSSRSRSRSRSGRERRPSSAFPFLGSAPAMVPDADDDDNGDDEFEDASDGTDRVRLKAKQRTFQLQFKVDTLKGSLYRSDPQGKHRDQLLVEVVAQSFGIELSTRPYDMSAEVWLGSVTMDDFVDNPPAEFKSIIYSGDNEDREQERSLVHVKFTRVNRQSPEFMPVYEGVEMNVTAAISTINVIVTRKTLLTLLDFILVTFTGNDNTNTTTTTTNNNNNNSTPKKSQSFDVPRMAVTNADRSEQGEQVVHTAAEETTSIRVKVDLKAVRLILNNDGIRLATLSFNQADVNIFLHGRTMRIAAKLGDLSLVDDVNVGVPENNDLRRLVAIEGEDLADLRYETFDASNPKAYPGYDSSVYLRAGSVKVNFVEEPFRKIVDFLVKFGKMQALFNAARQAAANQASQIQQSANRIKFDIVIMTPIVVFPRIVVTGRPKRDLVTAYLGEIYAQNKFAPLSDSKDSEVGMKINAGIRKVRLTSDFHYPDDKSEELEMIDHVDLGFNITYAAHKDGAKRPDTEVVGTMSDINLRLTQYQLKSLLDISRSVPAVFAGEGSEDVEAEAVVAVDERTLRRAESNLSELTSGDATPTDLAPELGNLEKSNVWTKLDLAFHVDTVALELILAPEDRPVENLDAASLSKFALDRTKLKTRMLSDGALQVELLIYSFNVVDSRQRHANKFRNIMVSANPEVQQLMASITMTGGKRKSLIAMATVDSPRVIFALDYLFALQKFITAGLQVDEPPVEDDVSIPEASDGSDAESSRAVVPSMRSGFHAQSLTPDSGSSNKDHDEKKQNALDVALRVNVVDAQVILIANPLSSNSEAIVLGTRQVLLSQQNSLMFQVSEIGMFLCRMDKFEVSRLRIIDDFSIQMSMDSSQPRSTSIHVDVEPLILSLSLRDILLALQIITKASELSESDGGQAKNSQQLTAADSKAKELRQSGIKQRTASGRGASTVANRTARGTTTVASRVVADESGQPHDVRKQTKHHEQLTATIESVRVVLIGDLHELPILDLGIKKFTASAADWGSNLKAEAGIDLYTNVYNFSKSSWEPLIEPWQVGLGVAREQQSGLLSVEVVSKKTFDVTITTATIALAYKSFAFLTQEQDVLDKPRGVEAPYRIRNHTGFEVVMQSANRSSEEAMSVTLADGEEAPWTFEHWAKMRENVLTENQNSNVTIKLEGSGFDPVKNVRISREGEFLYGLRPKTGNVLHRLLVDVSLGKDNVKCITLRSPLLVENNTEIPIEIGVYDAAEGNLLKIGKIAPGESRPAPVGAAYEKSLLIRPDSGFGYQWSTQHLDWRDLLTKPTRTMMCKGENNGELFFFQLHARHDKTNPVTRTYPLMKIKLSAPVTLENLLPYDFKYRIYDKKSTKQQSRSWTNFLRKGGVSPVHVVDLDSLLLLSIDMQDTAFKASDFAVINGGRTGEFTAEQHIACKDEQGSSLYLKLYYHEVPDSGGAFKVTILSPYVILNKTSLELNIRGKGFLQSARPAAGQFALVDTSGGDGQAPPKALPFMFSFSSHDDHRNRALLKLADSEWSRPQSFDAVGSTSEIVLGSSTNRNTELHIGMTVDEGKGKYKMTKVVMLSPRFVLQNKLGEDILVREPIAPGFMKLAAGSLRPLLFMQRTAKQQLSLCLPGDNNRWSSPFNISDIGTTHIKVARVGERQRLVRVEVLLESATIFLHLSFESKSWPFSMRNESDMEFTFYQANPNVDEDGVEDRTGWKPIRYRLPPRSIMPYAWDFPAAHQREVVICAMGRERHIKLAEIGNLMPMKFAGPDRRPKIIDINVAAQGPTQALILSNFKASRSLYRQKSRTTTTTTTSSAGGFEVKEKDGGVTFKAQLQLSGIGISLINSQLKELAYVTFRGMTLRYSESRLYQTVSLAIKWIQIDNQLYGGIFPMVLYPSVVPKRANEVEAHPSLHAMVTRVKDDSYGVLYLKYATILLQQLTIELDEDFVFAVLDFSNIPGVSWGPDGQDETLCDEHLGLPEPTRSQGGTDIYFEVLNIQPMQLDLSFMRTERVNAEDRTSSRNPVTFFMNIMTMAIGNVNDAPVRFNALVLENVRVSMPVLMQNITSHYSQEVLYQIHKILGSADFIGNPVGLFNNISSGVTDIFYEPYQGLILSDRPEEFGLGIAKGAASFVKKSVYGFSDAFSKMTGSMSKGLVAATMDKQFQDRRRQMRARNRPKHALYGVTAGANSFFTSVASGVSGIASKPIEGAAQEGLGGFLKGVAKGAVGLATKPVIGVLDMASNVSEGIRNTTTVFDGSELDRVRLPRFIPADGIVRPYNAREALGQLWLKQVDNGRYFDEQYIAHLELPREDMVVMITFARILLIRSKRLNVEWDVLMKDLQTISKERTGISLILRGGQNGPFIPVADESGRAFLYRMVAVAVDEFNRRFRGMEG